MTQGGAKVGCSCFRFRNDDLRNHNNQSHEHKTWNREDNQLALYYNFRSNPIQRGYRKRMIEICQEFAYFQTRSQRLADQVRTIMKEGWFSDLEIVEIHQKINSEQDNKTVPDTSTINKQKQPNRYEPQTSENGNTTHPNNKTKSQEQ